MDNTGDGTVYTVSIHSSSLKLLRFQSMMQHCNNRSLQWTLLDQLVHLSTFIS